MSHDPSEIILIWVSAGKKLYILSMFKTIALLNIIKNAKSGTPKAPKISKDLLVKNYHIACNVSSTLNISIWYILNFLWILWWIESLKEQHLFEIEIYCNILNVFINLMCAYYNASFKKKKKKLASNFQTVNYCMCFKSNVFFFCVLEILHIWSF